jgi:ring-1,2-phenylacetyl-CoA epoxidase subunit PaaE
MADYNLKIKEIIWETGQCATLKFKQPLFGKVRYTPGQFLTILCEIDGKKVRRSYSMSSSPDCDADIAVTIKRVENGLVSNYLLDKLKVGDSLEVMKPTGNFIFVAEPKKARHIVLIGAGSGITPLMSILKTALLTEKQSRVTLIYGNRHEGSIIFRKNLDELKAQYADRFTLVHSLTQPDKFWGGYSGRIDKVMVVNILSKLEKTPDTVFYLCGPQEMMQQAKEGILKLGYPAQSIKQEAFVEKATVAPISAPKIAQQEVTVVVRGKEHKVVVQAGDTILNAALDSGLDMPFSCQSGLCTACMGRKKSGEVYMEDSDALSKSELDEGYVLTCISKPLSPDVVIEV